MRRAQAWQDGSRLDRPQVLDTLLTDALKRRNAADSLLSVADRVGLAGIEPMPMPEIVAQVKATHAEHKHRAGNH